MKCECGYPTIVKDGRYIPEGYWRRRCCDNCGKIMTTLEQVCETVKGKSGHDPRQPVIKIPQSKKVSVTKARKANAKPVINKMESQADRNKPAWLRIEEMREQRKLEKDNDDI